ncbi:unnamed protein product [Symbiodinium sp. CCMP2592]|nr:unnamed protein product [Symbiodinium sp. CCMP2592]
MPFTEDCKERSSTGAGFRAVSISQLRISLETLHSPVGAQAAEYQRRCESQRKLAPERIPLHHCDPKVHGRILHAYADVLFQRARVELKGGRVQCIALAQDETQVQLQHDVRKGIELIRARFVLANFEVKHFMLDVIDTGGRKDALAKCKQLQEAISRFAEGDSVLIQAFTEKLQVFCSDGEAAEPLSARFLKEAAAPNLRSVVRCTMHCAQKSLENSIHSSSVATELLNTLVYAYSSGRHGQDSDMGGLARAIRNSEKLKTCFERHVQAVNDVDKIFSKAHAMNFAPQRFNTILEMMQFVSLHAGPLISMLTEVHHADPALHNWSKKMLQALCPDNLVLCALLAELAACAAKYCHAFDAVKKSRYTSMTQTAALLLQLKQELHKLFAFQQGESMQEPLCLADRYTAGYLQSLQRSYNLLVDQAVVKNKKLVFYHPGAKNRDGLRSMVAKALGTVQAIVENYLGALDAEHGFEGLAWSLQPFDCESWERSCRDDALFPPQMM